MLHVQNNGRPSQDPKWVFYAGTDLLLKGYNLCYTHDAELDPSDKKLRKGVQVSKPETANLNLYAGVVLEQKQGPSWVLIQRPQHGDIVDALTDANQTKESTVLGPQDGSYALNAKPDSTFNLAAVALALETVNTDATNANSKVSFIK